MTIDIALEDFFAAIENYYPDLLRIAAIFKKPDSKSARVAAISIPLDRHR